MSVYAKKDTPMEQTNKLFRSIVSDPKGILQKLKAIKLLSWTVLVSDVLLFWLPFHLIWSRLVAAI